MPGVDVGFLPARSGLTALTGRMTNTLADKATLFRTLHSGEPLLVLPNAWDVASARIAEDAGAAAVATTSAGVAWSLGAPDGDVLERDDAMAAVARIAAAVRVPVSADIEGGYARTAAGVGETVRAVIDAGAVGINIEDGERPAADLVGRIAAAREAARAAGVELFINARTDIYLRQLGAPEGRLGETLARAVAYLAAGADGVFVPGVVDAATVAALAEGIAGPLNILVGPGAPTTGELGALGVARVTFGSAGALAAYGTARRAAVELLAGGSYEALAGGAAYGELNELLGRG
jgi:2-methylisocitrate lyase-like PEP mutase family enzyme